MGLEWGGRKDRIKSNATLQMSYVTRHALPHVTGTEKDAVTIVTYMSLSNSTVPSQTVVMQTLVTNYITCLGTFAAEVAKKELIFKEIYNT
jgi:hypothetical protein